MGRKTPKFGRFARMTHSPEQSRSGCKAHSTPSARLFSWAGRVRYAWRPAAPRAGGSKLGTAARLPIRINGAISSFPSIKPMNSGLRRACDAKADAKTTELLPIMILEEPYLAKLRPASSGSGYDPDHPQKWIPAGPPRSSRDRSPRHIELSVVAPRQRGYLTSYLCQYH